ncbi:MAG: YraN family protein [bacterium]
MSDDLGQWGEDLAASYLRNHNWTIDRRNYETPFGECDLVITQDDILAFVEVKTRRTKQFGPPEEAITPTKKDHLRKIAQYYLGNHETSRHCRFDVVAIQLIDGSTSIRHIEGAFT